MDGEPTDNWKVFSDSCFRGDISAVRAIIENQGNVILERINEKDTYTCNDIISGGEDKGKLDPNNLIEITSTPFAIACRNGHTDVVRYLLTIETLDPMLELEESNASVSPFAVCCVLRHLDIIQLLLNHQRVNPLQLIVGLNLTALHIACYQGNLEVIQTLLADERFDVNDSDTTGQGIHCFPVLYIAAMVNNVALAKLAMSYPTVDVNRVSFHGHTSLYRSCQRGATDMVALLLEHPELDVNILCHGKSPLYVASKRGHLSIVELLLRHPKIDVNFRVNDESCFSIACKKNHSELANRIGMLPSFEISDADVKAAIDGEVFDSVIYFARKDLLEASAISSEEFRHRVLNRISVLRAKSALK